MNIFLLEDYYKKDGGSEAKISTYADLYSWNLKHVVFFNKYVERLQYMPFRRKFAHPELHDIYYDHRQIGWAGILIF
jgi:hypothetical protein